MIASSTEFAWMMLSIVGIGMVAGYIWRVHRPEELLCDWATREGIRILACEERDFARGPYFLKTGSDQVVYRVTVEFPDGRIDHGWIRCGAKFLGLISNKVEARWDDPPGFPIALAKEKTSEDKDSDHAGQ